MTQINEKPLTSTGDVTDTIQASKYGDSLDLIIQRGENIFPLKVVFDFEYYLAEKPILVSEQQAVTAVQPQETPLPTPVPTPQQSVSSSSTSPSQPDEPPSLTLFSMIPAETDKEILEIQGSASDDKGIKQVNVSIQQPTNTKGLLVSAEVQQERRESGEITFSKNVTLDVGHNEITIEAIDTIGQTARQELTVVRKALAQPEDVLEIQPVTIGTPEGFSDLIQRPGNVYAVIIGIGTYQDKQLNLQFTVNDAQGLYDVFTDPNYGGMPKNHIKLLLDENATDRKIKGAIGRWLSQQATEEDTVIIYYSGHGAPEGDETYWVTYNADINDLFTSALNNNDIADMLSRIRAKRMIIFLDSSYSAATVRRKDRTRTVATEIPWEKFSGEGRVTISASDGKQLSLELQDYQHGVFTYYLLEGLKGQADDNRDGVVEVEEIWDYVKYQVTETARKAGNPQTPVFQGEITAGIPLTFNLPILWEKQQQHVKQKKQKRLQALYEQGLIQPKYFDCAFKILDSGEPNRYIADLLSDKISPETFGRVFRCDSQ